MPAEGTMGSLVLGREMDSRTNPQRDHLVQSRKYHELKTRHFLRNSHAFQFYRRYIVSTSPKCHVIYRESASFISITLRLTLCVSPRGQILITGSPMAKARFKNVNRENKEKKYMRKETPETYATFIIRENRSFYQSLISTSISKFISSENHN